MSDKPTPTPNAVEESVSTSGWNWLARLLNPWIAISVLLVVAFLSAPFVYRQMQLSGLPDIEEPFDVEAYMNRSTVPADNAIAEYTGAISLLIRPVSDVEQELVKLIESGRMIPSAELLDWLSKNQPALQAWKKGTQKPLFAEFEMRNLNYATLLNSTQELRSFARMAIVQGIHLQEQGKPDQAIEWYLAAYRSSLQIQTRGCLIQFLVGYAIQGMAAPHVVAWSQHNDVTAEQIQQVRAQLTKWHKRTVKLSDAMKSEYVALRNTMQSTDPATIAALVGIPLPAAGTSYSALLLHAILFVQNEPTVSMRGIKHWQANLLRHIDKPLYDRPAHTRYGLFDEPPTTKRPAEHLTAREIEAVADRTYLFRSLLPAFQNVCQAHDRFLMRQQLLDVVLALEMYRKAQGRYPKALSDLPKSLLAAIPQDLFDTKGASIKYKRVSKQQATVYSNGKNRTDDGGDVSASGTSLDLGYPLDPARLKPVVAP